MAADPSDSMLRVVIKWYLVVLTAAGLLWGASHAEAWLEHNSQEEACASVYAGNASEYAAGDVHADFADGLAACRLNLVGIVIWAGIGVMILLVPQIPAYAYLMVGSRLRHRSGGPAPPPVLPAVAKTFIATLTVLGFLWFGNAAHRFTTDGLYLDHCNTDYEASPEREHIGSTIKDEACRIPTTPVIARLGVELLITFAVLQSPAWAYLYFRRRRRIRAAPAL